MNPRLSHRKSYTVQETNVYPHLGLALDTYLSELETNFPGILMQIAAGRTEKGEASILSATFPCLYSLHDRLFYSTFALTTEANEGQVAIPNNNIVTAMSEYPGIIHDLSKIIANVDVCYTVLNLNRIITNRDFVSLRVLPDGWPERLYGILTLNHNSPFQTLNEEQQTQVRQRVQESIAAALYQWLLSDINLINTKTSAKIVFITRTANAIGQTPLEIIGTQQQAFMNTLAVSLLPTGTLINHMITYRKKENTKKGLKWVKTAVKNSVDDEKKKIELKKALEQIHIALNEISNDNAFLQLKIYSPAIVLRYLNETLIIVANTENAEVSTIRFTLSTLLEYSIEFINKHDQMLLDTEHGRSAVITLLQNPILEQYGVKLTKAQNKLCKIFENKITEKIAKAEEKAQREALYQRLASEGGQELPPLTIPYLSRPAFTSESSMEEVSTSPSPAQGSEGRRHPRIVRNNTLARLNHFFHEHTWSDTKSEGDKNSPSAESAPAIMKAPSRETSPQNTPQPQRKKKIRKAPIDADGRLITQEELTELGVRLERK